MITTAEIERRLFEMKDEDYKDFHSKLMPTIPKEQIIGVRTPQLRAYARELFKSDGYDDFLADLPHAYYDENNLHGFIVSQIKDYDKAVRLMDLFLPYVDNWATCDLVSPKAFEKNKDRLKTDALRWIGSDKPFTVRFGIEMMMTYFLDADFDKEMPLAVSKIRSNEYYVNMMIAWYFATALAKQWEEIIPYLTEYRLDKWTHNKAIQKASESYRITAEQKKYLKSLKVK